MDSEKSVEKQTSPSFGAILRRERQLREISLRDVSDHTKISITYLEALERDDFGKLPGGAFTKGFLRSYAEFIGLDPEEMVNHYLFEMSSQRLGPEPEAAPLTAGARLRSRGAWIVGAMVVAAAVILIWVWSRG